METKAFIRKLRVGVGVLWAFTGCLRNQNVKAEVFCSTRNVRQWDKEPLDGRVRELEMSRGDLKQ